MLCCAATGAVIRNNSFHHTTCNLGRTKSSNSIIEQNTWAHGGSNMEITGLENWMEGPMLINNVTVRNNTFLGEVDGAENTPLFLRKGRFLTKTSWLAKTGSGQA